ncbi:hypothetical protein EK21DRAFT_57009 [Setomelanomma holmii]|uniref:Glycoside hydrolase 131 catalytic N-terminal domain-containing protein n=1 Tax=Setomelanomma holmii TaxID=210430 RepID=A0A9P4HJN7_9PLEO|nr:hypothetical protein EK21DRAFT_57009 [Setomelanomma holmii]
MFAKPITLLSLAALGQAREFSRQACDAVPGNATATAARIVYDDRIKANARKADFDSSTGPYGPDFVKGQNLTFSQLVAFPAVPPSLFDTKVNAKPFEVQIKQSPPLHPDPDFSIFVPNPTNPSSAQTAVRRTKLSPSTTANLTTGIKTLHVSLRPSIEHPLNKSHEYSLVFLERGDFSADLFMLRTGTLLGSNGSTKNDLVLQGNTASGTKTLFTTPSTADAWTNIALQLDFSANTIQAFSSTGNAPLVQATAPLENDLSGNGQFHFGVNKNPTNPGADVLRSGLQESRILEGVVYGGTFVEDVGNGTVTLA